MPEDVFLDELQFYEISEETILEYKVKEGFLIDKVCAIYTVLLNKALHQKARRNENPLLRPAP